MTASASTSKKVRPAIAEMAAPGAVEDQRAIVVSVYHARELLSSVERAILDLKEQLPHRSLAQPVLLADIEAAMTNLSFAEWLTNGSPLRKATEAPVVFAPGQGSLKSMLQRAHAASLAALGHGRLAESYTLFTADEKMSLKMHSHWHKATELARQEAHRALALLAEVFPDAYEKEVE